MRAGLKYDRFWKWFVLFVSFIAVKICLPTNKVGVRKSWNWFASNGRVLWSINAHSITLVITWWRQFDTHLPNFNRNSTLSSIRKINYRLKIFQQVITDCKSCLSPPMDNNNGSNVRVRLCVFVYCKSEEHMSEWTFHPAKSQSQSHYASFSEHNKLCY